MQTLTKTFWRTSCCLPRKSGMKMKREGGNCNKTRRLVTRQSPPSVGWSSMGLRWWKGGPLRAMTLTRSRTFGLSSTRDLRTKSSRQKKEWKRKSVTCGMNLIRPSYTTSLSPYQTACGGFGRPRGARAKQSSRRLRWGIVLFKSDWQKIATTYVPFFIYIYIHIYKDTKI